MKKIKVTELLIFIVFAELVGVLSAFFSGTFTEMYLMIERPPLSPPGWVFPVVWSILYALMGISAYIISNSSAEQKEKKRAIGIYAVQLGLNFLWSIIFFRFELFTLALVDLIALFILVVIMTVLFYKISKIAGFMNIPYIIWLLFALYLNIGVVILN